MSLIRIVRESEREPDLFIGERYIHLANFITHTLKSEQKKVNGQHSKDDVNSGNTKLNEDMIIAVAASIVAFYGEKSLTTLSRLISNNFSYKAMQILKFSNCR